MQYGSLKNESSKKISLFSISNYVKKINYFSNEYLSFIKITAIFRDGSCFSFTTFETWIITK
jgi:hypothetical protein